ncbi:MAG: hypothetical protein M0R00_02405 [Candidatus Omnitrophica bacterium]|jgi:hypothetical protein|nr:hypothetical protein [Candidatus Omnitrophota bacterium]
MGLFENLKNIFSIDFRKLEKIDVRILSPTIINQDNSSQKIEGDVDSKELKINVAKLSVEEKVALSQAINSAMEEEGYAVLEKDAHLLLEDFEEKDKNPENQGILNKLKELVPSEDIPIWRGALYLKSCFEGGKKVDNLKSDIICKFGDRGRKIANLCSAGYLDKMLNIYNTLIKEFGNKELAKEKFGIIYSTYVDAFRFTIFVSHWDKLSELLVKIQSKIDENAEYGIKFVNLHGISLDNISKIKKIIEELEKKYNIEKNIAEENKMIFAKLNIIGLR